MTIPPLKSHLQLSFTIYLGSWPVIIFEKSKITLIAALDWRRCLEPVPVNADRTL